MVHNLTDVASSEAVLASIVIPLGSLNTLINLFIIASVIKIYLNDHDKLEARILFEVFSLFSSNVGLLFGVYGIFYLDQRIPLGFITNHTYITYAFIFHRFLLIGSDLLPSMDRCIAVIYPLKYYTRMSLKTAFSKYKFLFYLCTCFTNLVNVSSGFINYKNLTFICT